MRSYEVPVSFRLKEKDIANLDMIVAWEKNKGPISFPANAINRTSVLRALIERELQRLDDEQARVAEKLAKDAKGETAKDRKSRVQRERRERKRLEAAKRAPIEVFAKMEVTS